MYYSLAELRKGVVNKLYKFNHACIQKRDGSRYEVLQEEKKYFRPLPDVPYGIAKWIYSRAVNLDFHVVYKKKQVFLLVSVHEKKGNLKVTDRLVDIYYIGKRLTTHNRFPDYMKNKSPTHPENMTPPSATSFSGMISRSRTGLVLSENLPGRSSTGSSAVSA